MAYALFLLNNSSQKTNTLLNILEYQLQYPVQPLINLNVRSGILSSLGDANLHYAE